MISLLRFGMDLCKFIAWILSCVEGVFRSISSAFHYGVIKMNHYAWVLGGKADERSLRHE